MKLLFITFNLVCNSLFFNVISQTHSNDEINFELKCIKNRYSIQLPYSSYDLTEDSNKESFTKHFTFVSKAYIAITCGIVNDRPILKGDKLKVLKEVSSLVKSSRSGIDENNLHWREDNYKSFTILFLNVKAEELEAFEKALDDLKSEKL